MRCSSENSCNGRPRQPSTSNCSATDTHCVSRSTTRLQVPTAGTKKSSKLPHAASEPLDSNAGRSSCEAALKIDGQVRRKPVTYENGPGTANSLPSRPRQVLLHRGQFRAIKSSITVTRRRSPESEHRLAAKSSSPKATLARQPRSSDSPGDQSRDPHQRLRDDSAASRGRPASDFRPDYGRIKSTTGRRPPVWAFGSTRGSAYRRARVVNPFLPIRCLVRSPAPGRKALQAAASRMEPRAGQRVAEIRAVVKTNIPSV